MKKTRTSVLRSRGINSDINARIPSNQWNLLETGSGLLAGGSDAADQLARAAESVNLGGGTARDILTRMHQSQKKNDGRNKHMAEDAAVGNRISPEELKKRYAEAKRLTSGVAFGVGNGELGTQVRDEVIRRNKIRKEKEVAAVAKKGQKLRALCDAVRTIQRDMKKKNFKWTNAKLTIMCRWKRQPGDKKLPTLKDELLARWEETKGRPSPQVRPVNSDDEGESDDDDEASLGEEESESEEEEDDAPSRGLEWGSDDEEESSESESESEEDEWCDE